MFVETQCQAPLEADEAPLSISEASAPRARLRPLDEAALHFSNALQTDALRQAAGEVAAEYTELHQSVVTDLQRAGAKIREAILDLRRGIAPAVGAAVGDMITSQVEKAAGFADRVVTGRTDNAADRTPGS
jgi:hypothetical protein